MSKHLVQCLPFVVINFSYPNTFKNQMYRHRLESKQITLATCFGVGATFQKETVPEPQWRPETKGGANRLRTGEKQGAKYDPQGLLELTQQKAITFLMECIIH